MVKHIVNYDDKVYKSSNWQDADQLAAYMVWPRRTRDYFEKISEGRGP